MKKHRAMPKEYMTVDEIAKMMGVTVCTMKYYDKKGVLSPASESEGGCRLYTHKDIIVLFQIKSMQYLGYTLEDIKDRLLNIETPEDISNALAVQVKEIKDRLKTLKDVLVSLEELKKETEQMEIIDWAKYADIVFTLQARMTYVIMRRKVTLTSNQNGGK